MVFNSTSAPIRFVLPIRDMLQSLYGGKIPHNAPEILAIYRRLKEFNDSGPVKICGVEGHGGALPQYDVLNGRYPLAVAENITEELDPSLFQRPLIRGPFGVTLNAMHKDDLRQILQAMAESGGAKKGHRVVFKLFEAQNRPSEYLDSLKIISELKREGYDVACEVAMVISDKPGLDISYYEKTAARLLDAQLFAQEGIDPSAIVGFSLKDMIGGVKASQPDHDSTSINAKNLAAVAMNAIQQFAKAAQQQLYLGWHTHEIGNGADCLVEATQTFVEHRKTSPAVTEFQQDAIVGSTDPSVIKDFGFVDLERLLARYNEKGVMAGMSERQQEIWGEFKGMLLNVALHHRADYIDASQWSKELLEYGQLASGGLPDVEKMIATFVLDRIAAMQIGRSVKPVGKENAAKISRSLFASINGLLASDLGNAHSVTPAMKLLNQLTMDVMVSLLEDKDFLSRCAQSDRDKPLSNPATVDVIRKHYNAFRNIEAMTYFCTPMPTPIKPKLLNLMRSKLFDHYFPKNYSDLQKVNENNSASMLKGLSEQGYCQARRELAQTLLDKEATVELLTRYGVDRRIAGAFAASHIGVNELPLNHGVKPRFGRVVDAVNKLIAETGGAWVRRRGLKLTMNATKYIIFSSMLLRARMGETISPLVEKLARITPLRKAVGPLGSLLEACRPAERTALYAKLQALNS